MIPKRKKPIIESWVDSRIWPMIMLIGLFAYIVLKEIELPSVILAAVSGLGLLGLFMTGVQHPELTLYVLVIYLPFSRELVGDFSTQATALNLTNILMIMVFIGHAVHSQSRGYPIFTGSPMNKLVWFFCIMGAMALFRAGFEYGSSYLIEFIFPLKRWLTPVFCYFLTLWVVREKRTWKAVVILIMVTVSMIGAMATWDYFNSDQSLSLEKSRIGSIAQNPNTLAAFFNYYMFLLLSFFLTYAGQHRTWLLLIPFALCFRGIMVTFSRGGYLGFMLGTLGTTFFKNAFLFMMTVGFFVTVTLNPALLPKGIQYRMGMTIERSNDPAVIDEGPGTLESSAATRVEIWKGAVEMIKDHPWWGVGYGAFPAHIGFYTEGRVAGMDAHNSYLLIASEMGIPTLVVFLIILLVAGWYTFWFYRRTPDQFFKATALGFLGGLSALLIVNFFGSRIDSQEVSSYLWILIGLIMRGILMEQVVIREAKVVRAKAVKARLRAAIAGPAT
ncbi:MAG: O-antigen ligase family protein [Candidatus Omnitrophica bacterium]|nr:O-antigen ligase family protein [Candidatus Omnitrophota bacterium]